MVIKKADESVFLEEINALFPEKDFNTIFEQIKVAVTDMRYLDGICRGYYLGTSFENVFSKSDIKELCEFKVNNGKKSTWKEILKEKLTISPLPQVGTLLPEDSNNLKLLKDAMKDLGLKTFAEYISKIKYDASETALEEAKYAANHNFPDAEKRSAAVNEFDTQPEQVFVAKNENSDSDRE
jgi:hypothetical protein